jgi:hypothetical protein
MGVILLTSLLSVSQHPSAALIGGVALLVDSLLPDGHPYHRGVGAVMIAVGGGYWLYQGTGFTLERQMDLWAGLSAVSLVYLVVIGLQAEPQSVGDFDGELLKEKRVRAAQFAALALAIVSILINGISGFQEQIPLWSAMVGVAVYPWASRIIRR